MKKLLALMLVLVMVLSLCACGKKEEAAPKGDDTPAATEEKDSNVFKVNDYEAVYTGYELLKDKEGKDAILVKFDFTNNSDVDMAFAFGMYCQLFQGDTSLDYCTIYLDEDESHAMDDSIIEIVSPGKTLQVQKTYTLKDTTTPVRIQISDNAEKHAHSLTIDITK